ncbi:MAG TPA: hypothetical protein VJ483_04365 [Holophagaceae bacterium]|nr:hypothetical protein [Holophagaceae bacterium]
MRLLPILACAALFLTGALLAAQPLPYHLMSPSDRALAQDIVRRADFQFSTRTPPKKVRMATMEKLFDHPRVGMAMWRVCQFVPPFYASIHPDGSWSLVDGMGLHGHLRLIHQRPGWRIYLVEGWAEKGRLKHVPMAVKARMLTSYRYWEGKDGFESQLETWTALDSALLGFLSKPFHGYIHRRQDEFIAYINSNIATFGEFADLNPSDFEAPLKQDGDAEALRDYNALFGRK